MKNTKLKSPQGSKYEKLMYDRLMWNLSLSTLGQIFIIAHKSFFKMRVGWTSWRTLRTALHPHGHLNPRMIPLIVYWVCHWLIIILLVCSQWKAEAAAIPQPLVLRSLHTNRLVLSVGRERVTAVTDQNTLQISAPVLTLTSTLGR